MQALRLTKRSDMLALLFFTIIILAIAIFVGVSAVMSHQVWESTVLILLLLMWIGPIAAYYTFGLYGLASAVVGSWLIFGTLNYTFGDHLPILSILSEVKMEHLIFPLFIICAGLFLYLLFSMAFEVEFEEDITLKKLFRTKRYTWNEITKASASLASGDTYIIELSFKDDMHIHWQLTASQLQQWHTLKESTKTELVNSEESVPDSLEFSSISSSHYTDPSTYINSYTIDEAVELSAMIMAFIGAVYGYGVFGVIGAILAYVVSMVVVSVISYILYTLL